MSGGILSLRSSCFEPFFPSILGDFSFFLVDVRRRQWFWGGISICTPPKQKSRFRGSRKWSHCAGWWACCGALNGRPGDNARQSTRHSHHSRCQKHITDINRAVTTVLSILNERVSKGYGSSAVSCLTGDGARQLTHNAIRVWLGVRGVVVLQIHPLRVVMQRNSTIPLPG